MSKKIGIVLVLSLLVAAFSFAVLAEETPEAIWSITFDNDAPVKGDTVTVSLNLQHPGAAVINAGLTFDRDLVEYIPYTQTEVNRGFFKGDVGWEFGSSEMNQTRATTHGEIFCILVAPTNTYVQGEVMLFKFKVISDEVTTADFGLKDPANPERPYPQVGFQPETGPSRNLTSNIVTGVPLAINGYTPPVDPVNYDLTVYPYGAEGTSSTFSYEEGTVLTATDIDELFTDLSLEGFTFTGWVDVDGDAIEFPYTVSADAAIYGSWEEDEVIVDPDPIFGNLALQTTATSVDDIDTTLRFLIGIDSLDYASAGFKLSGNGNSFDLVTSAVYESFGGMDASAFGGNYIVVVEINNIPKAAFSSELSVEAFVETLDGTYEFASSVNFTVADAIQA